MNQIYKFLFTSVLLVFGSQLKAESGPFNDPPLGNAAPNFIGITILGNPSLGLSSISDYSNGVSVNHNTLRVTVALGVAWSVQIRALDDLRYQSNSIPVSAIGIQSVNLGTRPEVLLSTADQTIASGLANLFLNQVMTIRYRAVGGTAFLKPAGSYTTTIVLTYTGL